MYVIFWGQQDKDNTAEEISGSYSFPLIYSSLSPMFEYHVENSGDLATSKLSEMGHLINMLIRLTKISEFCDFFYWHIIMNNISSFLFNLPLGPINNDHQFGLLRFLFCFLFFPHSFVAGLYHCLLLWLLVECLQKYGGCTVL